MPRLIPFRAAAPAVLACALAGASASAEALPPVTGVDFQPVAAQVRRVLEALDAIGSPPVPADREALAKALESADAEAGLRATQEVLDRYCLAGVRVTADRKVRAIAGPAAPELVQQGWRAFLVKVHNEARLTDALAVASPQAAPVYGGRGKPGEDRISADDIRARWLDVQVYGKRPLAAELSGLPLEYRIVELHSRDAGPRDARLVFTAGPAAGGPGFRNDLDLRFDCRPAVPVTLRVKDERGDPCMASFLFRDARGRVYPAPSRRLAPDFFFHPQVYRADGETIHLPAGEYDVEFNRGPESRILRRKVNVPAAVAHEEAFQVVRWIDPAATGWISGDHHVHAAGCMHYEKPTEGVFPQDMMRHVLGEDLKVACLLTWGPCYYFQKQFFTGEVSPLSTDRNVMRYDMEISGFPSQHAGHIILLRLRDQDYPGTKVIEDWPSWDLPIFTWAKAQGSITGFAHSGWGLKIGAKELPSLEVPPFDSIGACEYVVDITHDVPGPDGKLVPSCDFYSLVDTPAIWELNVWYHTLGAGFRARGSGETDFPCIYGDRVGLGRGYVHLPPGAKLTYDAWVTAMQDGRSYVSDGWSHLMDFRVNDTRVGVDGSELKLDAPGKVTVRARVAALLGETPNDDIRNRRGDERPFWHIERARIGATREVPVELIVNGRSVAKQNLVADGTERELTFDTVIESSAWVALRVLPSAHTNPVFVLVGGKPIRVKESLEWALKAVDQCWSQKERGIRPGAEREAAAKAYEHAREVYRKRLQEAQ